MAQGYARTHRQGRRLHGHQRARGDQLRHLPGRRQDGLRPDHRHHRPGRAPRSSAPTPSRRRRSSRSAGPITKHHYLISRTEDIPRVMKEAFHIATTGRPGPVIIDIPKDVQINADRARLGPADEPARLPADPASPRGRTWSGSSPRSAEPRSRSSTPAAASSTAGPRPALRQFAETTGIPVALTLHGLGGFPADHYLCLHMLGMHGTVYSNYAINEADLLLAFGVRFDDRVTGKVERVRQARQDRPHRHRPVARSTRTSSPTSAVHGDLRAAVEDVNALLEGGAERRPGRRRPVRRTGCGQIDQWRDDGAAAVRRPRRRDPAAVRHPAAVADPQASASSSTTRSSPPASASTRCGRPSTSPSTRPRHWVTSRRPGDDGLRPAGRDGRPGGPPGQDLVIDIDGDGSFLMNIQELACASRREAAGQGAAAQQPAPRHGGAVGGPVLRRQPRPHLPRGRARTWTRTRTSTTDRPRVRGARPGRSVAKADLDAALEEMID